MNHAALFISAGVMAIAALMIALSLYRFERFNHEFTKLDDRLVIIALVLLVFGAMLFFASLIFSALVFFATGSLP